jgi:hypothetical protein
MSQELGVRSADREAVKEPEEQTCHRLSLWQLVLSALGCLVHIQQRCFNMYQPDIDCQNIIPHP